MSDWSCSHSWDLLGCGRALSGNSTVWTTWSSQGMKKIADKHLKLLLHYYFDILCPFPWEDSQASLPYLGFVIIKIIHVLKVKLVNFDWRKFLFRTTLFGQVLNVTNLIGEEVASESADVLILFWFGESRHCSWCMAYNSHLLMKYLSSCVERSWVYVAVDLAAPPYRERPQIRVVRRGRCVTAGNG